MFYSLKHNRNLYVARKPSYGLSSDKYVFSRVTNDALRYYGIKHFNPVAKDILSLSCFIRVK